LHAIVERVLTGDVEVRVLGPFDVAGEKAELEYEQALEKQELDWPKTSKIQ